MRYSKYIKKEYKKFVDMLDFGNGKYHIQTVFQDFVLASMIAIKNRYDYSQEDEDVYLRIMDKYTKEEQENFPKLLAELYIIYFNLKEVEDVLGYIFEAIGLSNGKNGQFFTPDHISRMMAKINITADEINNANDFVSVADFACGSGALLLGTIEEHRNNVENFKDKVIFYAKDIDFTCVCMTFLQLTFYGVAAEVTLGNALTNSSIKKLYTPEFVFGNWSKRIQAKNQDKKKREIVNKNKEINEGKKSA